MIAALALAIAASAAPAAAGDVPPRDAAALAQKVQGYYERTKDLEARFVQDYTYAAFGRTQTSSGTLRVKKPGKIRWEYERPARKTVLVSGNRLTQYEPEANQVYVDEHFDLSALSAAVTFLVGKGSLEKEFTLASDAPGRLVLTPRKPDARVTQVVLTVAADGQVTATRVEDAQGNANALRFEDLRRNVGLPDSAFELKLPADVHRVRPPGG
ncbi:MAG TPA: outer membrane lipoprotein carrier protein LolA [Anaeromyxobacteraceae bacterium]|nr:outer membrane lipoprotein carrier protein LolA [Anaeromyxobacteraceae bacterium]